ncbi:MAG: hypothetical protein K2X47_03865 [Bdellovibrionales bacterium]|nr:hypothetical protein [Bdellovibrionales bacterium]
MTSKGLTATIQIEERVHARGVGSEALFDCPVIKLVSYVFENHPQRAFEILRRPISLNWTPKPISLSVIQVLAKRWTLDAPTMQSFLLIPDKLPGPKFSDRQRDFQKKWIGKAFPSQVPEQIKLLREAESLVSVTETRHQSSRPIVTIIADQNGVVASVGWNLRSENRLWHAELVAVHGLLPMENRGVGSLQVYTSLQPCRMCASYILRLCSDLNIPVDVFYREADDGPKAKNTGLELRQRLLSDGVS